MTRSEIVEMIRARVLELKTVYPLLPEAYPLRHFFVKTLALNSALLEYMERKTP